MVPAARFSSSAIAISLRRSARLPRDFYLRESATKEAGVGRAAICRGQGLAQDEKVPIAHAREGKHRSFADHLRAKLEAACSVAVNQDLSQMILVTALVTVRPHTNTQHPADGRKEADKRAS
jgi:hypothetical protein